MERVGVIGPTGWGTTLAALFADNGHDVSLVARTEPEALVLERDRENRRRRPGLRFPKNLRVTSDVSAVAQSELLVLAVPSATVGKNLDSLSGLLGDETTVVSGVKGIEPETGRRMSELIVAAGVSAASVVVLSGPNFAKEIAAGLPAATVLACRDEARAARVQTALTSTRFRAYTTDDVVGVEIGGALKNVVAIACGISDGAGMGQNAKAALMTRALAEITRLGVALGARSRTFLGLSGIGDLIATCESNLSRNRRMGLALIAGRTPADALAEIDGVVEGVSTARAVRALQRRTGVEMPISEELYAVLFEGKDVVASMRDLMSRQARSEIEDV